MLQQEQSTSAFDFKDFFNALPGLHLVLSADLHVTAANNAFLRQSDLTAEEVIGRYIFDLLPEKQSTSHTNLHNRLAQRLHAALKNNEAGKLTQVQLSLPGSSEGLDSNTAGTYWDITVTPVQANSDQVDYLMVELQESTKQHAATEEQHSSPSPGSEGTANSVRDPGTKRNSVTQHILDILEALPLMIWTATPDGTTNYCNKRWSDYTGFGFEAMVGTGWQQFIHPDDWQLSVDTWNKSVSTGTPLEIENRWKNGQDGSYRWFLGRAMPLHDSNGNIILWVGSNTDIHEQKQSQDQLERSEKQFRFLTESIPQMVWSANPDGYIDYTNHRWFDYTKMDENSLGFGWAPAIHPDELDKLMSTWLNCVATGEKLEFKVRFQDTEAKTYRWFLLRSEPMHNEEGQIVKWFGTATDIHDQVLMQEQLQESEKQFRFLAESIPQMIWTTRPDGYHDYFNQRWMNYTGLTLEESMGMVWNELVHPEDREASWNRWQHSLRTGDYYEVEYRFKSGYNGNYRWFLGQAMPMRDEDGNIVKWFGTCTDIEDHKKAEEELLEKNLELERTNQELDSFVYTASHDLKLPVVNMVALFDELLRVAEFKDPEAPKMIGMFNNSLQQIQNTINELSEVVRVQKSTKRELECLPLQDVTRDVLLSLQHHIEDTQATVTTDFSAEPCLHFTRSGLKSILYNLLSNAIKYRANDRLPVIHISSGIKDNFTELKITDNGIGIDINKHQNKLFQMFRRFHNHVNGSGLGLYIVNRLLTNHGGYVNIESKLDEGTTFYLYFKQKKA